MSSLISLDLGTIEDQPMTIIQDVLECLEFISEIGFVHKDLGTSIKVAGDPKKYTVKIYSDNYKNNDHDKSEICDYIHEVIYFITRNA